MRNSTRSIDVLFFILSLLLLVFLINSCTSTQTEVLPEQEVPELITQTVEPEPPAIEEEVVVVVEEPVINDEPEVVVQEPVPEVISQTDQKKMVEKTAEYERSVSALSLEDLVSADKFEEDKKDVLATIEELTIIMADMNYQEWLKYVSPASRNYWANPKNLAAVTNRLPIKGLKIRSLQDYFKFVFVPSRLNRVVDEIRYVSSSIVKAVQVSENQDIIFYYFEKINGKWLLKLDELEG